VERIVQGKCGKAKEGKERPKTLTLEPGNNRGQQIGPV